MSPPQNSKLSGNLGDLCPTWMLAFVWVSATTIGVTWASVVLQSLRKKLGHTLAWQPLAGDFGDFFEKKPPRSKMVRHPHTHFGRVAQKNNTLNCAESTFEGSFWMVSKVSKEEIFMKTGGDCTGQREDMAFQYFLIHQKAIFSLPRPLIHLFD